MMRVRLAWLTSAALLGLALLRLGRIFLPQPEAGPPARHGFVLTAAVLSVVVAWSAHRLRLRAAATIVAHVAGAGTFLYVYLGYAISDRFPPRGNLVNEVAAELADGLELLRATVPVEPKAGVVALALLAAWMLAALACWGLWNRMGYLAVVPPAVFYLQLAVIDQQPAGMTWTAAFLAITGAALAAAAAEQRAGSGRPTHQSRLARLGLVTGPVVAVAAVTVLALTFTRELVAADVVPEAGVIDWNAGTAGRQSGGSISYNPFINVRRSLVSISDAPVFEARLSGPATAETVYWRLAGLDAFNGGWWYGTESVLEDLDVTGWEAPEHISGKEFLPLTQDITIRRLNSALLPAVYSPTSITSGERRIANTTRVDPSNLALRIEGHTVPGMTYRVESRVPGIDLGSLATDPSGSLTPLFALAAAEGAFGTAGVPPGPGRSAPGNDYYLQLPSDIDPTGRLQALAGRITAGLETDFERALALEHYLRDPAAGFTYAVTVPVEERRSYLTDWLTNPASPGYRTGYCEQFSASMGVLARLAGIPARTVLGFTPGEPQPDGSVLIRDRNAHAWVEIWIAAHGWVGFDPTPRTDGANPATFASTGIDREALGGYLAAIRAAGAATPDDPARPTTPPTTQPGGPGGPAGEPEGDSAAGDPRWLVAFLAAIIGVVALGAVPLIKHRRRRRRMQRLERGDVTAAWAEVVDRLVDGRTAVDPSDTPMELAVGTGDPMVPLAKAHTQALYGDDASIPTDSSAVAAHSLSATEAALHERETRWQQLRRTYSIRSLRRSKGTEHHR